MKLRDIAGMALHNLWTRKARTALNLLGVVIGCVLLVMTLAGTRGASEGLQAIVDESAEVRQIVVYPSFDPDMAVPEEALAVEGEMSEERRERLRKAMREQWLAQNSEIQMLDQETLQELRSLQHVEEVVARSELYCGLRLSRGPAESDDEEQSGDGQLIQETFASGISPHDEHMRQRVIAGGALEPDDQRGALLSEFAAYRLGFRSDGELKSLIGRRIEVEYHIGGRRMSYFLQLVSRDFSGSGVVEQAELLLAIKHLVDDVDATGLSPREKELVREAFRATLSPETGTLAVTETFIVRGVVRPAAEEGLASFLSVVSFYDQSDLYVHHRAGERINLAADEFEGFWAAVARVDDVQHLRPVVENIESRGYGVQSALWIVDTIDAEVDKARLAISTIALVILAVSAIGVYNTLTVSVVERTPEFGIMKALGARNSHVLALMLCEGALMGMLGAASAIAVSWCFSWFIGVAVRAYIEGRIGREFPAQVFIFAPLDVALVFLLAAVICTLAGALPAWRAARVDPVVAMQRR